MAEGLGGGEENEIGEEIKRYKLGKKFKRLSKNIRVKRAFKPPQKILDLW